MLGLIYHGVIDGSLEKLMKTVSQKNINIFLDKNLPNDFNIEVHKSKDGFWAEVHGGELENCYSQGKNFKDLLNMICDSMYTYLRINGGK